MTLRFWAVSVFLAENSTKKIHHFERERFLAKDCFRKQKFSILEEKLIFIVMTRNYQLMKAEINNWGAPRLGLAKSI